MSDLLSKKVWYMIAITCFLGMLLSLSALLIISANYERQISDHQSRVISYKNRIENYQRMLMSRAEVDRSVAELRTMVPARTKFHPSQFDLCDAKIPTKVVEEYGYTPAPGDHCNPEFLPVITQQKERWQKQSRQDFILDQRRIYY